MEPPYSQGIAPTPPSSPPACCPVCLSSAAVSYPAGTGSAATRRTMAPNSRVTGGRKRDSPIITVLRNFNSARILLLTGPHHCPRIPMARTRRSRRRRQRRRTSTCARDAGCWAVADGRVKRAVREPMVDGNASVPFAPSPSGLPCGVGSPLAVGTCVYLAEAGCLKSRDKSGDLPNHRRLRCDP